MLEVIFTGEFEEDFCEIDENLFAYWNDASYGERLLLEIKKKLDLIAGFPGLFAPFWQDVHRFFVVFHGIEYVVFYTVSKTTILAIGMTYSRSDYTNG